MLQRSKNTNILDVLVLIDTTPVKTGVKKPVFVQPDKTHRTPMGVPVPVRYGPDKVRRRSKGGERSGPTNAKQADQVRTSIVSDRGHEGGAVLLAGCSKKGR